LLPITAPAATQAAAVPPRSSHAKSSLGSAWSVWQATRAPSAGTEFLTSIASWTEGTAAQLLRQRWPVGAKRPSSPDVQHRLRHSLELAAVGPTSTYPEALEWARRNVVKELRKSQGLPPLPH
jgi:hypothetical protein